MQAEKEDFPSKTEVTNNSEKVVTEPKKRSKVFLIILIVMILGGGWFGISKYLYAQHHEETDDAQVEADIIPVIPRVSGYVKEVRVKDNQMVHKGDTLIILDDRDYQVKLDTGRSGIGNSQKQCSCQPGQTLQLPVQESLLLNKVFLPLMHKLMLQR